jgi:hypothetical protein
MLLSPSPDREASPQRPDLSRHVGANHQPGGLALCGLCGNKLSVRRRYNNRIYYCSQNPPAGGCGKIQRVADKLGRFDYRLDDKVAREVIKESTAKRQRFELDREMDAIRRDIDRHRGGQVIALVPRNLRDVWPDLSLDRRRNIIKAVLVRVTVNPQPNAVVFDPDAIVAEWRV